MVTGKLYYENAHLRQFEARVLTCGKAEGGYEVTLSATAFYPEGGGQAGDTGSLGNVKVLDTRERGEEVVHLCDGPLEPGTLVTGTINWEPRFQRMQSHSGEHMVSGIIHSRYGWHNTGFHMGADCITIDFDGVVPQKDLPEIEAQVNGYVWQNLPIRCWYPDPEELARLPYRTKKQLPWPVRIVEIPGVDLCACCGTHVEATGEIGLIKLLDAVNFRGGTRIQMACGAQAFAILNAAYGQNKQVSQAFSARMEETGAAARKMNKILAAQKYQTVSIQRRLFSAIGEGCRGRKNPVCFEDNLDGAALGELAETISAVSQGFAAVFTGNDQQGYQYCIMSTSQDLRPLGKQMNQALAGRGGGKPNCQQGRVGAKRQEIERFFQFLEA